MKKITILMMAFFGMNIALADNFNYASTDACRTAMSGYQDKADALASKNENNDKAFYGFMALENFFRLFTFPGTVSDHCSNGACIYTISVTCDLAKHSNTVPWSSLIVPVLSREAGYLERGEYDPGLAPNAQYYLHCHHQEQTPIDWNNCSINTSK